MSVTITRITGLSIVLACLMILAGCSSGGNAVQPQTGGNLDSSKVHQAQFTGRVEFPNDNLAPSEYKIQVAGGIYEIKSDGTFEVPMNMGTTGLITVLDPSSNPVLYKVFPKHELLREQKPVVNAESTAVAFMYLNPALARYNDPLKASVLLETLRRTDAVRDLTAMITESFGSREVCSDSSGFWNVIGKGFDELMSKSKKSGSDNNPESRKMAADQSDPWFFDRNQSDSDKIDLTNFVVDGTSATIDYQNNSYKWWMLTIDPTSSGPEYIPSYRSDFTNPQVTVALIPPASFEIPGLSGIIDDIVAENIAGIAGWISTNHWDFTTALALADHNTIETPSGELNFTLPNWGQTYQLSGYSMGFRNDLGTTSPASPDRSNVPALFQIIYQLVVPVFSIYYDGAEYALDPDEICSYVYAPQFDIVMNKLNPSLQKLQNHLYNYQGRLVLNDCYEIVGKILAGTYERWFVKNIIFRGNIPDPILGQILYTTLSSEKLADESEQFSMFLGSMVYNINVPNFDNYIVDLTKYSPPTLPYDLKVTSINRGESGADPELITSIDLDWDDVTDAFEYVIERADGYDPTDWDTIDTVTSSGYKYILSDPDWDDVYRFRICANITGVPEPEISQEVFTLFVSNAGESNYHKWFYEYESDALQVTVWFGGSDIDSWPQRFPSAIGFAGYQHPESVNRWAVGFSREIPDLVGQSEAFCDGYMSTNEEWKSTCGFLMGTLSNPKPFGSLCSDFIPENKVYNDLFAYNFADIQGINQEFCTTNQDGWAGFNNTSKHVGYYLDGILNPDRDYFAFGFANGGDQLNFTMGWGDAWAFVVQ